jgi:hypothetical protein
VECGPFSCLVVVGGVGVSACACGVVWFSFRTRDIIIKGVTTVTTRF